MWSQAGQDQRAWADHSVSRQDQWAWREKQRGPREREAATAASVHQREPEAQCRVATPPTAAEWPSPKQLQQFQSKPASDQRVGRGSSVFLLLKFKTRRWFVYWAAVSLTFTGI